MQAVKDFLALMNPTRWAVLGGVLAGLVMLVSGLLWRVHAAGAEAERGRQAQQQLQLEREYGREVARLQSLVNNWQEVYLEQTHTIDVMERNARGVDARRMRAERNAEARAIAAAQAPALREFATTAADRYRDCRTEYRALGFEHARCSAGARTLDQYAAEVSGSRPAPPDLPSFPVEPDQ